jgi:hypothetical protein
LIGLSDGCPSLVLIFDAYDGNSAEAGSLVLGYGLPWNLLLSCNEEMISLVRLGLGNSGGGSTLALFGGFETI